MERALEGHRRIAFDTAPLIYFLQKVDPWWPAMRSLLLDASSDGRTFVVSTITEMELRVGPLRAGRDRGEQRVDQLLAMRFFHVVPMDRRVAREGASFRAAHRIAPPDAVVAATATVEECSALVGNDARFRSLDAPWTYIHLDDHLKRP